MGAGVAARVLRRTQLFGELRQPGDPISIEEWNKVSPQVRDALVNQMNVRRVFSDDAEIAIQALLARMDELEAQVKSLEATVAEMSKETVADGASD